MAKERERRLAEHYYIEKNRTATEIASLIKVTEATISGWVRKYGWKTRREAKAASPAQRVSNIKEVISLAASERIEASRELEIAIREEDINTITEIRKRIAAIDDGASKWNKALSYAIGEAKVPLVTYLDVMEWIFGAMRHFDEKLYLQTIDFQEHHVTQMSDEANR